MVHVVFRPVQLGKPPGNQLAFSAYICYTWLHKIWQSSVAQHPKYINENSL